MNQSINTMLVIDLLSFIEAVIDPERSSNLVLDHERNINAFAPIA